MKMAAIYSRVSTEDQAIEGTSLDSQTAACKRYAESNGYRVLSELREERSGATLNRPRLDDLRDMVKQGLVQVVIVYKLDRLSRDTGHTLTLLNEFRKAGVEFKTATAEVEDTAEGRMMLTMLSAMAEYERTQFIDRTRRGKEQKARSGKFVGTMFTPYAYRYVVGEGRLELVEEEAHVVRQMFEWVVNEGLSLRGVARRLNVLGVTLPRGGQVWRQSSVRSILRNHAYTGTFFWNKTRSSCLTSRAHRTMTARRRALGR